MKRLAKHHVVSGILDFIRETNDTSIAHEVARKLQKEKKGEKPDTGFVTSASTISSVERSKIEKKLRGQFKDIVAVSYKEDPKLLGGFIIRVGDWVYDSSISGQLENFRQMLYGTI